MGLLHEVADDMWRSAKWYALLALVGGIGGAVWAWFDPLLLQQLSPPYMQVLRRLIYSIKSHNH